MSIVDIFYPSRYSRQVFFLIRSQVLCSLSYDVMEQLNKTTWQYLAKLSRQAAPTGLGLAERNKTGAFDD